jgi:hypothetical protein
MHHPQCREASDASGYRIDDHRDRQVVGLSRFPTGLGRPAGRGPRPRASAGALLEIAG